MYTYIQSCMRAIPFDEREEHERFQCRFRLISCPQVHTYIHTRLHTYIHTYTSTTCIHTYMPIFKDTYIKTYIYTPVIESN